MNVTVNETSSLVVNVTDPDGDSVSLTLRTDTPPGASFDNLTGVFTWTPVGTTPVNITYVCFTAYKMSGYSYMSSEILVCSEKHVSYFFWYE